LLYLTGMHEQNLPTPVTPENPPSTTAELGTSLNGEAIDSLQVSGQERVAPAGDRVNQGAPVQQSFTPTNLPQPINNTIAAPLPIDDSIVPISSNPAVADDVDVIEKAWVQKAKSIVEQTKTDPHQQEEEVSKLQTDYQIKRFGEPATSK